MPYQRIKFYQTGSFAAGNRLLPEDLRSVQSSETRSNTLTCGHRACQGCGICAAECPCGAIAMVPEET